MEKYLVIYTEEEYRNCQTFDVIKNQYFDDFDEAIKYITELKAFAGEWEVSFDSLLEVKEISVDISQAEIQKLIDAEQLRKETQKKKLEDQREELEKQQLKRLKEKYEK